ncbi:MAG: type II secretion system minor pseudopilin GspH [Steroidobacteraceae bacterium]|nr:type II secretion system minor pseudopilin GspH [Steroidobacteraceae bacterium]
MPRNSPAGLIRSPTHPRAALALTLAGGTFRARPLPPRGFTLIELLVVVLIIGIIATTAVLSIGAVGRDTDLEKEGERLSALLNYAREKAELQTRELGLFVNDGDYEFLTYDPRRLLWRSVEEDDALRRRELPAGLALRLEVEGRPVVLKHSQEQPEPRTKAEREKRDRERLPHVMIFSNGDITPFRLTLKREEAGRSITLSSNEQGQIESGGLQEERRR